ncbi:MAG: TAXI family TRAP transporter solute-binding subunit, partial [Halofilum sp. (in: g-proteobacteria)]|nr:TAXI family TRAP transporter solute-binding subunit [Halofilum sp. (in: g-proteobacteria)]
MRAQGAVLLAAGLLLTATDAIAARQFITIGTGNVMGVPYHAGGAICALVNAGRTDHQIRCTATSSAGSIENIDALRRGERDFGFAQSDLVQHAYRGSGPFADRGGFGGLRVVAALHPETLTLVAAPGSGIADLQGLRGKRVNVGAPGSGERATLQ